MRPERAAQLLLSVTRSKAKMYEYDVPESEHIALPRRPELLFSLAVGLLGDAAAAIADDEDTSLREGTPPEILTFAGIYFDAYLQSRLSDFAHVEFPVLSAASYYLSDNPGSAKVLVLHSEPPAPDVGAGLALLTYRLLRADYSPFPDTTYGETANQFCPSLRLF